VAAIVQPAPLGFDVMPTHNKAFGLYGIDVLLTEQLEPIILEVNFAPDGLRASQASHPISPLSNTIILIPTLV
jgi:glutathione synthase/RimK-type ligase-like ATP-grasp enzyme